MYNVRSTRREDYAQNIKNQSKTGQYRTQDWKSTAKAGSMGIFLKKSSNEAQKSKESNFFIIAVQTLGSGISILLAVGTLSTGSGKLYCQWELSSSSGNALCILFPTKVKVKDGTETKKMLNGPTRKDYAQNVKNQSKTRQYQTQDWKSIAKAGTTGIFLKKSSNEAQQSKES
nr:hypothetical protein [Tanacetum cinerariifolium]